MKPSPDSQSPHTPPLRTSLVDGAQPTRRMTGIVNSNIGALLEQRAQQAHERRRPDRIADTVTRFAGSMTFVLISQNRMQAQSDRQAALDLQVNLLAEHEITRLVELVTLMAGKMGIEQAHDPELQELAQDVRPERVMSEIEKAEAQFHAAEPSAAR